MRILFTSTLLLTLAGPTFAMSTSDQYTQIIQNNESRDSFSLNTQVTRTEYRTQTIQDTCYRQEISGYRRVCTGLYGINQIVGSANVNSMSPISSLKATPGHDHPTPHPTPDHDHDHDRDHDQPRHPRHPVCHDEPIFRTVAYSCMKTISVPYEVFDHNAQANINVRVTAAPATKPQTGYCGIAFNLSGDNLSTNNSCSEYLAIANQAINNRGYEKNYNFDIRLYDAQVILAPLEGRLQGMHVEGDNLVVQTGTLTGATNFSLKLYVERKKLLQSDVVLINRVLRSSEFYYEAIDGRVGLVKINLDKLLGGFESKKKHVIKLNLDVKTDSGIIINNGAQPSLHQESSIII